MDLIHFNIQALENLFKELLQFFLKLFVLISICCGCLKICYETTDINQYLKVKELESFSDANYLKIIKTLNLSSRSTHDKVLLKVIKPNLNRLKSAIINIS